MPLSAGFTIWAMKPDQDAKTSFVLSVFKLKNIYEKL